MNLAVYIHWPFCKSKCPYCDFNSHVANSIDQEEWCASYLKQIGFYTDRMADKNITSIFFGGGTPSLMAPKTVDTILSELAKKARIAENAEITLEANPTSIECDKFIDFKKAGINRVSIGVQSFDMNALKFLGREHSANEAISAIEIAKKFFDNFSFDLIYARPNQTIEEWRKELSYALSMASKHISLYQLTIEKGTKFFGEYARKKFTMPDDDMAAEFYQLTEELTKQVGLYSYEISNYAKPGYESRHNLAYWRYNEYLGIGPGAHSRIMSDGTVFSLIMQYSPDKWQKLLSENINPLLSSTPLTDREIAKEIIIMGLRTSEGVSLETLEKLSKLEWHDILDLTQINLLTDLGYLNFDQKIITTSNKGKLLLNQIIERIIKND